MSTAWLYPVCVSCRDTGCKAALRCSGSLTPAIKQQNYLITRRSGLLIPHWCDVIACHSNTTVGTMLTVLWNRELFEMIVGVLTTCHTQYTWNRRICVSLFNRTILQVLVTYLTGALHVHPLWFYKHQRDNRIRSKLSVACQRWWFQWRFWSVPSVPGYLREEEEHKPDPSPNPIERNHMGMHLENEVAVVKTQIIISNNHE